jgi:hypothetical protein
MTYQSINIYDEELNNAKGLFGKLLQRNTSK